MAEKQNSLPEGLHCSLPSSSLTLSFPTLPLSPLTIFSFDYILSKSWFPPPPPIPISGSASGHPSPDLTAGEMVSVRGGERKVLVFFCAPSGFGSRCFSDALGINRRHFNDCIWYVSGLNSCLSSDFGQAWEDFKYSDPQRSLGSLCHQNSWVIETGCHLLCSEHLARSFIHEPWVVVLSLWYFWWFANIVFNYLGTSCSSFLESAFSLSFCQIKPLTHTSLSEFLRDPVSLATLVTAASLWHSCIIIPQSCTQIAGTCIFLFLKKNKFCSITYIKGIHLKSAGWWIFTYVFSPETATWIKI